MSIKITFRAVAEHDKDFLKGVYASTRYEELRQTGWSQQQIDDFLGMQFEAQHQFYQEKFSTENFEVILCDGVEAGRLYLEFREDEIRIVDIALLPEFRGKGLGTRIVKNVIIEAQGKSISVRIHVEKNNPALTLYQRLGFEFIDDRGVYWLMEKASDKQAA